MTGRAMLVGVAVGILLASNVEAEEWPGWRGPRLDGSSAEKGLPLTSTAREHIAWKTPIPGVGHSSPVVYEGQVFVTSCLLATRERVLLALERSSGKRAAGCTRSAAATPCTPASCCAAR